MLQGGKSRSREHTSLTTAHTIPGAHSKFPLGGGVETLDALYNLFGFKNWYNNHDVSIIATQHCNCIFIHTNINILHVP
jgi:hypothetical protein